MLILESIIAVLFYLYALESNNRGGFVLQVHILNEFTAPLCFNHV